MREGPGRLAGQRSTEFGAIQLTIDERHDYIAVIHCTSEMRSFEGSESSI